MKRISLFAALFAFAALFSVSASAQATAQPKFAVINTAAFDGKDGLTRYNIAMDGLEKEFAPVQTKIQGMMTRYQTLAGEIKKLQEQPANVPIDQNAAQTKVSEYQTLEKSIKREQEDAKANFDRRQQQVMGPLLQDIGKAMQDYANQKGYDLILDAAKLDNAGLILAFNPTKVDVTKDFITFYNARPAGAASAAAPAATAPAGAARKP
jgi:Skp family chaperone for outer membrane proteins